MKLQWWFTLVLGASYLALFNLWMKVGPPWIVISGLGFSTGLLALLWVAAKRDYFVNRWDALFHASVILDVALEATLINRHDHVGFYLCSAAFAIVLTGYRFCCLRFLSRARATMPGPLPPF